MTIDTRDPKTLHDKVGSFWVRYFHDADALHSLYAGILALHENDELREEHLRSLTALREAYPFQRQQWAPLSIEVSDIGETPIEYGEGLEFGDIVDGEPILFGDRRPPWRVRSPAKDIYLIVDKINRASQIWVRGVDFYIADGYLFFNRHPRELGTREHRDGSEYLALWACGFEYDTLDLSRYWGSTYRFQQPSSERYADALYALQKTHVCGPTRETLELFLGAAFGAPYAREDGILDRVTENWVATDKEIIKRLPGDTAAVAVRPGTEIPILRGQCVTTALKVTTLEAADLPYVTLGGSLSSAGTLTFENQEKALTVITEGDTTSISFEIDGNEDAKALFFESVNGTTPNLASLLDRRKSRFGPPTEGDLPNTVNPYKLIASLTEGRLLVVVVDTRYVRDPYPKAYLRRLRGMLLPTTALLLVLTDGDSYQFLSSASLADPQIGD